MGVKSIAIDATKIKIEMARKQLTRKAVCQKTGISESYFSAIVRKGKAMPKTAGVIADALGVDVTEILQPE